MTITMMWTLAIALVIVALCIDLFFGWLDRRD